MKETRQVDRGAARQQRAVETRPLPQRMR